jgi:hypothetical protein
MNMVGDRTEAIDRRYAIITGADLTDGARKRAAAGSARDHGHGGDIPMTVAVGCPPSRN